MDGNANFGGAAAVFAKTQTVTDHLFVASDGGLNPAALGVARRLLPADPALLGNALQMAARCVGAVSAVSLGTAVARGGTMTKASGSRSVTVR
jgi:hypothetical protein